MKYAKPVNGDKMEDAKYEAHVNEIEKALDALKLRDRKNIERKIKNGDCKYDKKIKKFVYIEDEDKQLDQRNRHGQEDDDEDDYDDEDDDDQEEQKKPKDKKPKKEKKKQDQDEDSWDD